MEYRCEVVTPAGRKRYIEILYVYLKSQKDSFDTWQLWLNTDDREDIEYMRNLEKENNWIKCIPLKAGVKPESGLSICHFFEHTKREDTIYIRLDDDIVYLSPNFVKDFKELRLKHREEIFLYPNIINNAVITHIHQRNKLFKQKPLAEYECMGNAWKNPIYSEKIHFAFLESLKENNLDIWQKSFHIWTLDYYERVSINSLAWFGSVMKNKIVTIKRDEEHDISVDIPNRFKIPHTIINGPICAHFAFFTQREYLESKTDILQRYKALADELSSSI